MEIQKNQHKFALHWDQKGLSFLITRKRFTVGSGKTCDIILPVKTISAIHAVIELQKDCLVVYDMNSTNGTFYRGKKIVSETITLGDEFFIADQKINFITDKNNSPPPILDMLAPRLIQHPVPTPVQLKNTQRAQSMKGEFPAVVQYPLASDPKALYSEYIFEDVESLHPIFKYDYDLQAIEVIILYQDKIISADYLPYKNTSYFLVGKNDSTQNLEFAYLPRNEKQHLLKISGHSVTVYPIDSFSMQVISDSSFKKTGNNGQPVDLKVDDIVCYHKGPLSIFIRLSGAPPKVKSAPFFTLDKEATKYFFLIMLLTLFLGVGLALFPVNKEKEIEKAPDRVVQILYKKPAATKAIAKTEDKPIEQIQKAPVIKETIHEEKVTESKPAEQQEKTEKIVAVGKATAPQAPAKKAVAKQAAVEKKLDTVAKNNNQKTNNLDTTSAEKVQRVSTPNPTKGPVDTFKSLDFSASLNSVLAKGGQMSKVKAVETVSIDVGRSTVVGGASSATVKTATLQEKVGSLSGVATGKLDTSKGLEGVVSKKSVLIAGIPDKIVVLGGMDPDTIDKILRDHLPQFRYCYQKVLDRSSSDFEGRFTMNFIIAASGHVSRVAIIQSNLPENVNSCVENVVRGIKFPEPRGGGTVEVNKPLNFMVKNN